MPYFNEDMNTFNKKIDQIDIDVREERKIVRVNSFIDLMDFFQLNSHEFRAVLPAVVRLIEEGNGKDPAPVVSNTWCQKIRNFIRIKSIFAAMIAIMVLIAIIVGMGYINVCEFSPDLIDCFIEDIFRCVENIKYFPFVQT